MGVSKSKNKVPPCGRSQTNRSNFMNIDLADVTIHVDETLDASGLSELEAAIRQKDGVVSVHVEEKRPHLFVVEYNPQKLNSKELLEVVESQGMHAELVGL